MMLLLQPRHLFVLAAAALLGCPDGLAPDDDDSAVGDDDDSAVGDDDDATGDDDDATGDDDDDGAPALQPLDPDALYRVEGEITWSLDFDSASEAEGYEDCSYTRSIAGTAFGDQPWRCPDCDVLLQGNAEMIAGYEECAQPIFGGERTQIEAWGFSGMGSEETSEFHRGSGNRSLAPLSPIASLGTGGSISVTWSSDFALDGGPSFALEAIGGLELILDEKTVVEDAFGPRVEDYVCGWPTNNPGDLTTDNRLAVGQVIPTALLEDRCGEMVNLWDFHGSWLLLDTSQPDCPPCRTMAEALPGFVEEMRAEGHDFHAITLLGAGLSASTEQPAESAFQGWLTTYGEEEPVFRDRGYGSAVFGAYHGKEFGFPSYALIAPDMTMVQSWVGFGTDRLDEIAALVREE